MGHAAKSSPRGLGRTSQFSSQAASPQGNKEEEKKEAIPLSGAVAHLPALTESTVPFPKVALAVPYTL